MTKGEYFYQIEFLEGRGTVRRECVTKAVAQAIYKSMCVEMILFGVSKVTWGKMD